MKQRAFRNAAALAAALSIAGPVQGRDLPANSPHLPVTYLVSTLGELPEGDRVAPKGQPLAQMRVQPDRAVVLQGKLDPAIGVAMAVTAAFPFVEGRRLYGWPDQPGLFCDLMRNRGLGSSTACLRDNDADGAFDEALRYDFNSGEAHLAFITDKGKTRGGHFKGSRMLSVPIRYVADNSEMPDAKVRLLWTSDFAKRAKNGGAVNIELTLTDGTNFTGTEIMSERYFHTVYSGKPVTMDIYGVHLTILGFDETGGLKYRIAPGGQPVPVGFVFHGYRLIMITVVI